ncbi:hypothetical protein [Burkholderia ambifaria]|uniref:hypothetical protein n=1 Tax=Burkholderia ambifaria TaxID=152480 RepID=UPI00158AAD7E|nr:hypothetical protein [Burkholderia ambifaria]
MTTLNVEFSDETESRIVAYFAAQQDPDVYENLGTVDTSDERWSIFYNAAGGVISGLPAPEQPNNS